jgi:trans-aconitate methyltransferase
VPETTLPAYRRRLIGMGYDALNRALWLPYGSDRLRRDLVDALAPRAGDRVLEPGCGTGLVTRHLVATGASVVAIDSSQTMLARARSRAPAATFERRDVRDALPDGPFDAVVLGFVLHELDPEARVALLRAAAERLGPDGRIGVLEWGVPDGPSAAWRWRLVVQTIEPPVAHDLLDGALDAAIAASGLTIERDLDPAGGRARIVIARPS